MKVLVTGSNGQLGKTFKEYDNSDGIEFIFTDSTTFDITNAKEMDKFLSENKIDYLINCAAYTNVDEAEINEKEARLVNSLGPSYLAILSKKYDFTLIHLSTDYVFSGESIIDTDKPYSELDKTSPINVYGESKLIGEGNIKNITEKYYIIRTSWLYSIYGNNFFNTVYDKLSNGETLKVTTEQIGSPTSTHTVVIGILRIILNDNENYGIYHIANNEATTWYEFAKVISEQMKLNKGSVESINFYETRAKRPKYSALNSEKYELMFSAKLPTWDISLLNVLELKEKNLPNEKKEVTLNKWEKRFVEYAEYISNWSKDKKVKVGCVIVNDDNDILSRGYNGFPRGADDDRDQRRYEKPMKYMWTEHAERNAIFNAGRNGVKLQGSKLFCTYFPCVDCTRAIIQSGIKSVYSPKPDLNHHKWGESWTESIIMFRECGVEIIWT